MEKPIEISKKKKPVAEAVLLLLVLGGSALWVLIQWIFPRLEGFFKFKLTAVVVIVAVIVWAIIIIIKQSSTKKPGLIIDQQGVTDNTNILSVGFIPWSDIISIEEAMGDFKRKMIVLKVKNPEVYINKTVNMAASRQVQFRQFGSPIVIMPANLKIDPQALLSLFRERINKD